MPEDSESKCCHQSCDLIFSCVINIHEEQWSEAFVKRTAQRLESFSFKGMTDSGSYTCQHEEGLALTVKVK